MQKKKITSNGRIMSIANKEEQSSNNSPLAVELIKRTQIEGTPFEIIETAGKTFVTLGKYRLTDVNKTVPELIEEWKNPTWDKIIQIASLISDITYELNTKKR